MKIEVFTYEWTWWNSETDRKEIRVSEHKVTRECVAAKDGDNPKVIRRIHEGTREEIDESEVRDGEDIRHLIQKP